MQYFKEFYGLSRRTFLGASTTAILLVVKPHTTYGNSDGGDVILEDDIDYSSPYTWTQALRLSRKLVKAIVTDPKRRLVRIEGFSDHMSMVIWGMLDSRRKRTKALLKDMKKLAGKRERLDRLNIELRNAEAISIDLLNSLAAARRGGASQHVIDKAIAQINIQTAYVDGLNSWRAHPEQGPRR